MRVLFAGSPEIAVPALEAIAARHELVGVLTNPPSAKGRGLCFSCTPVAGAADALGAPVLSPERLGPAEREAVAALRPELLAVFAYGRIFGPKFMALFPFGGVNAHPSLLPRWRGCAPIPYAILNRDPVTGVCVQRVAPRMDSGDILARREMPLDGRETTESLSAASATVGAELLLEAIAAIEAGAAVGEPQDEAAATYCAALSKDSGLVDWSAPAIDVDARVRAFHPWPGAYTGLGGERLAILATTPYPDEPGRAESGTVLAVDKSKGIMVQTGQGLVAVSRLQLRGKKPMDFKDFANGARGLVGTRLDAPPTSAAR
ncbi:MAG: methionyl-tRNA formyltransferase [Spirochaetaceae bacterium]|nr:methionyl-tRNA formyltransferase [Spirochaetaceae bacterium]